VVSTTSMAGAGTTRSTARRYDRDCGRGRCRHVAETFIVTNVETWVASSRNGGIVNLDLRTVQHGLTLVGSSFGGHPDRRLGNDTIYGGGATLAWAMKTRFQTRSWAAQATTPSMAARSTIVVFSGARADYSSRRLHGVVTVWTLATAALTERTRLWLLRTSSSATEWWR
jgi:hypothetical protein